MTSPGTFTIGDSIRLKVWGNLFMDRALAVTPTPKPHSGSFDLKVIIIVTILEASKKTHHGLLPPLSLHLHF